MDGAHPDITRGCGLSRDLEGLARLRTTTFGRRLVGLQASVRGNHASRLMTIDTSNIDVIGM